jgi:2-dehydropantoate 2-reductase
MLEDVEAGRQTEIELITGSLVREAERHGVAAPLNKAVYALVRGREASALVGAGRPEAGKR